MRAEAIRRLLPVILLFAYVLRVALAVAMPHVHHADEIFQYVEQAHRAVFGYGIVPWEHVIGARSWLLPGFLSGVLSVSAHLGWGPSMYMPAIAAVLSLLSLAVVVVAFLWGLQLSRAHAIVAGVVAAVWFELVYFAPKPLTEVLATDFIFIGFYLAAPLVGETTRRRLFAAGVALGLALVLRFQLAPSLGLAALFIARKDVRGRWAPLAAGAIIPIILLGVVDWYTWGQPYHSILANFTANIGQGKAQNYGVQPFHKFIGHLIRGWSGAVVPLVLLTLYGARRAPLLLVMAVAVIASHSLIAHKEYRFIYPAIACIVVLAAFGSVDLLERLTGPQPVDRRWTPALVLAVVGWIVTSGVLATADGFRYRWKQNASTVKAMMLASHRGDLCGLAVENWQYTGGYSRLHQNIPLYDFDSPALKGPAPFNAVLAAPTKAPPPAWGFTTVRCFDGETVYNYVDTGTCLYVRSGGCVPQLDDDLQHQLRKAL